MSPAYIQGLVMGGSLIIAIGAQNAFVLSQGVRKNHHLSVAMLCIAFDIIFIGLGVSGVGAAVAKNPTLGMIAAIGGALFLLWYGFNSFRSSIRGGSLKTEGDIQPTLAATLAATAAVTLLNPHFYLDTVVLMGSISGQYPGMSRYIFGLGAMTASAIWFLCLSFGGQALAPVFSRPNTWRLLDLVIGVTMWSIAARLILNIT